MNTLKKFSVETHKGWSSFQAWIKKWNKIMAVIFSALGITLLLSAVIVNALEVHEESQKRLPGRNQDENIRLNLFETCQPDPRTPCLLYCTAGSSTNITNELDYHWKKNPDCQSIGLSINVASTIHFPMFIIPADWLNGTFKLKQLHIDVENILDIRQNAFTGAAFEGMERLVLINFHLHSMATTILQNLLIEAHFKHLTLTKNSSTEQLAGATVELYTDSMSYLETTEKYQNNPNANNSNDPSMWSSNMNGVFIISLTIVGFMLSFCLGLLVRYRFVDRKVFLKETDKNRVIFVIDNKESV